MIQRVHAMMVVMHTSGRQLTYKDHIVNFPQQISSIATRLPQLPEDLDVVLIRREGLDMSQHVDFIVRRAKVRSALEWKMQNDPAYADLTLDEAALAQLPENGSVADRVTFLPDTSPEVLVTEQLAVAVETSNGNQQVRGILDVTDARRPRREVQEVRSGADAILRLPVRYKQEYIVSSYLLRQPNQPWLTCTIGTSSGYRKHAFKGGRARLHPSRLPHTISHWEG